MDSKRMNKMLVKLKYKAFTLKEKGQLPSLLVEQIMKLGVDTPKVVYEFYIKCTEDSMRILGYYKKYKFIEEEVNNHLKSLLIEKGYYIN